MPEPNWAWAAGCITSARTRARVAKPNFFTESSLETLWNGVVGIRGKEHVLREVHFHAVSLPNRDGGRNLYEAVKDRCGGLRNTARRPVCECLGATRCNGPASLRDLTGSGDHTQGDRGAEDLKVVIVDLVLQPFLSDLVEAVKLIKINGITIRHYEAVENDGDPALLTEACGSNLLCFTQNNCSFGNDDVLVIVRIQRI